MTNLQRDGKPADGFSEWVRMEPRLDSIQTGLGIQDRDYWIHRYMKRQKRRRSDVLGFQIIDCVMLVEWKSYNARSNFSQRDTLAVVEGIMQHARWRVDKIGRRRRPVIDFPDERLDRPAGSMRSVRWFGVHFLTGSEWSPASSSSLLWDGRPIALDTLIGLLLFENNPDNPSERLSLRLHHKEPQKSFPLFRVS